MEGRLSPVHSRKRSVRNEIIEALVTEVATQKANMHVLEQRMSLIIAPVGLVLDGQPLTPEEVALVRAKRNLASLPSRSVFSNLLKEQNTIIPVEATCSLCMRNNCCEPSSLCSWTVPCSHRHLFHKHCLMRHYVANATICPLCHEAHTVQNVTVVTASDVRASPLPIVLCTTTIGAVKGMLSALAKASPNWFFMDVLLQDHFTLFHYNISSNCVIRAERAS